MVNKEDKLLILYQLEYEHTLNIQNLYLGFIGAFILSILSMDAVTPDYKISKLLLIVLLLIFGIIGFLVFNIRLEKLIKKIRKL
ncbi:MAG: hypothetical protein AABX11_01610 [Nanoarchaeota archaeon]